MKHLGDITKIDGRTVPPVDCIIGGSPCQDLSVAGERKGLAGERSGLFMEMVRIVKEMRAEDEKRGRTGIFCRPRFLVWENVPGAFSSNKRQDFRAVLEEIVRIAEPEAPDIPLPKSWPLADAYLGDGWSVAYRVLDAQFFGVPQRRRRIALVADFAGHCAPEILFERKGLSRYPSESGEERERATAVAERDIGETSKWGGAATLRMRSGCDGGGKGALVSYERSLTLKPGNDQIVFIIGNGQAHNTRLDEIADALNCMHDQQAIITFNPNQSHNARSLGIGIDISPTLGSEMAPPAVVYGLGRDAFNQGKNAQFGMSISENVQPSLTAKGPGAVINLKEAARRYTPLECERLQGMPDNWTDIGAWTDSKGKLRKESSDSARYKAIGNSIAVPVFKWVLKRLCSHYERDATMASLFDGVGMFPFIWEQLNGEGSCLWASEIEDFPIAVTKYHFGE